ncbi:hypothetical protein L6164_012571 [Bauhinia variegata]|uniref:Uncharacterized protein n=1 Tax=Bauhinia variegata TaxID=167791 RepID=A0ACB9PAI8_BAUVA|nr:hypothetical protein L6164_012571 [Bauhinia variegata]
MAIKEVEELGFDPSRYSFAPVFYALAVISKSAMQREVDVLKRWGWSDEAISKALATSPYTMVMSGQKIESVMEFLSMTWGGIL